MAIKQALGLAVSGTEVRLALLSNQNGKIHIAGLERARLRTTLENKPEAAEENKSGEAENNDAFGLKTAVREPRRPAVRENESNVAVPSGGMANDNGNLEILYRLLEKYTKKKTKIAFNVPPSMVRYQRPEAAERAADAGKDADTNFAEEVIAASDGGRLIMSYEKNPPTMALMREVNEFLRGNLFLALMDSPEVALANLARRDVDAAAAGKVSAIVYIEDDFTRLIFMRGKDLLHVSSIIHENTASPDILETIYRKLIYEQDEAQIPEIATIWLAGKSSRIKAREFFTTYFPSVRVDYLAAPEVTGLSSNDMQRGVFSEFAVPIALAWKTLEPKSPFFIPTNLLPQDLLDQQQILKLNYHGYILLALAGLAAFFFTWQILNLKGSSRDMRNKNQQLEKKIADNQETVDAVMRLDNQCLRLKKSITLADSLSQGHNEFLVFLQKLNAGLGRVGNIWVDEIVTHSDGFTVQGSAMSRDAIPLLAEKLGNASLRQMTRVESDKRKVFSFSLERYNAPDTSKNFARGLSTIDAARYAGNGKLVLGKESVRPAPTFPASNGAASTPAMPKPENLRSTPVAAAPAPAITKQDDLRVSRAATVEADKKRETATNFTPPIVKPAAATPPPVNANGLDKNRSAIPAPATSSRNSDLPVKSANEAAEKTADNVTRTLRTEAKSASGATGTESNNISTRPQSANGVIANSAGPKSDPVSIPKISGTATAFQPDIYRGYTIEAATSYTRELAEQYATAYRKQGHDAAVENYHDERTGAKKFRVLVGAFATRPDAEKKAAQIAGALMKDYRVVGLK